MVEQGKKLTFFQKNPIQCPLCETVFYREELLTGGGRMIAGPLTRELRRIYEPSKKFGEIYPLIYAITVCPACFYAVFSQDFLSLPEKSKSVLLEQSENRKENLKPLFRELDFTQPRTLVEGTASYILAVFCYDHFPKEYSPTIKQGLCCLRAAWCCNDLHRKYPNENYDYLAANLYRKARFFYTQAVEKEQSGAEPMSGMKSLGPDLDKDYGYDGVLYLNGLLELQFGPRQDQEKRIQALTNAKRYVAKIFGMGKASKQKPSALLDQARELYEDINKELERIGVQVGPEEEELENE
ncbi:MAG: DUF2225 domain-containing protein [Spirochaetales bacterium]